MRRHSLWSVLALVLLLATPALAQRFTASIRGTVTDQSNAVIAAAKVTVQERRRPASTGR